MLKTHLFMCFKNITIAKFNRPVLSCFDFIISKKAFKKKPYQQKNERKNRQKLKIKEKV